MLLSVNIDHIATLRQARKGIEPDPLMAAPLAILGGADGITVHLREDRRHIVDRDLRLLRDIVPVELNLEMAATTEMLKIAVAEKPDMVTLVPEKREELTTEGGLNMRNGRKQIRAAIGRLHDAGIPVSLFVNPDIGDIGIAKDTGADMVEVHTGMYANARGADIETELKRIYKAVSAAQDAAMHVNAGHGLNYFNIGGIAEIDGLRALYIGHSIISRAVLVGLERAVMEMKALISSAAP